MIFAKNYTHYVSLILILFGSYSCAFDKQFHKSEKIPYAVNQIKYFNFGTDTTLLNYDSKNQTIQLTESNGDSKHPEFTIKNHAVESTSGNQLNAWLLTPKNLENNVIVIHLHGSGGNLLKQYESIKPLVNMGYQIITADYSGYGFSEGESTRDNVEKDAKSFIEFALKQEFIKDKKVIIYGQSYGGYLTAIIAYLYQNQIEGIVIEGAFSSHRKEANATLPIFGNLVKNGPIASEQIKNFKKPVLIIHSKEDQMVPYKFGKKIYMEANDPKSFLEIDKAHIMGLQYYPDLISDKIQSFILKQ